LLYCVRGNAARFFAAVSPGRFVLPRFDRKKRGNAARFFAAVSPGRFALPRFDRKKRGNAARFFATLLGGSQNLKTFVFLRLEGPDPRQRRILRPSGPQNVSYLLHLKGAAYDGL
jgi:hypothetical protein